VYWALMQSSKEENNSVKDLEENDRFHLLNRLTERTRGRRNER